MTLTPQPATKMLLPVMKEDRSYSPKILQLIITHEAHMTYKMLLLNLRNNEGEGTINKSSFYTCNQRANMTHVVFTRPLGESQSHECMGLNSRTNSIFLS